MEREGEKGGLGVEMGINEWSCWWWNMDHHKSYIYIAQFNTNSILTALYIVIKYIQMHHMPLCVDIYEHSYSYTYTGLYIYSCTDTCPFSYFNNTYMYAQAYRCIGYQTHTHACIHTHTHTHTHTRTHAHTTWMTQLETSTLLHNCTEMNFNGMDLKFIFEHRELQWLDWKTVI